MQRGDKISDCSAVKHLQQYLHYSMITIVTLDCLASAIAKVRATELAWFFGFSDNADGDVEHCVTL